MSRKYVISGIAFCLFFCSACSSKKEEAQKTLEGMSKHKVVLPLHAMGCFHSAVDTLESNVLTPVKHYYVHYVDSSQCSPCALDRMYNWNKLVDKYSKKGINFVFVIEPKKEQLEDVHFAIESSGLRNPVYVDSLYAFRKQNAFLPEDKMYHSFLLDKNGHVVLVGNLLQNDRVKDLLDAIVNDAK